MGVEEIIKELESLGEEKVRKHYIKAGFKKGTLFGVKLGSIRKLAKKLKTNHELSIALWNTENVDARFLSILIMEPEKLSLEELEYIVSSTNFVRVADWVNSYVVKPHPKNGVVREKWMVSSNLMLARAGWNLTAIKARVEPTVLNIPEILETIYKQMKNAPEEVKWTMNIALAYIGIYLPNYRKKALAIGEELGVYRDYPVPKGCTSPFMPEWVNEMVRRENS